MPIHTGDYVKHISRGIPNTTYFTFTPLPLMEGLFYTMDDELASLLASTHRILGILEGLTYSLADKERFSDCMLLRESYFSKMVDFASFDAASLLLELGLSSENSEMRNLHAAYQYTASDTCELEYDQLASYALLGASISEKITTRTKQLFLTNSISNFQRYNPTAHENIKAALDDMDCYIESNTADSLIKAAMCHYQFEMIHPYEHSNGIIGRLLTYQLLNMEGLKGIRYLCLSESLCSLRADYFEKLEQTQKNGSYYAWITFFIQSIEDAAKKSIQLLKQHKAFLESDMEKLASTGRRSEHLTVVYPYFKTYIVSGIGQASQRLNIPFNAVSRAVGTLQNLGLLVQITEGARNRLFAHTGMMRLLLSQ